MKDENGDDTDPFCGVNGTTGEKWHMSRPRTLSSSILITLCGSYADLNFAILPSRNNNEAGWCTKRQATAGKYCTLVAKVLLVAHSQWRHLAHRIGLAQCLLCHSGSRQRRFRRLWKVWGGVVYRV